MPNKCDDCCPVPTCEVCGPCSEHDAATQMAETHEPSDWCSVCESFDHPEDQHDAIEFAEDAAAIDWRN